MIASLQGLSPELETIGLTLQDIVNSITLNDVKIEDQGYMLKESDFNDGFAILKKGKKSFVKLLK